METELKESRYFSPSVSSCFRKDWLKKRMISLSELDEMGWKEGLKSSSDCTGIFSFSSRWRSSFRIFHRYLEVSGKRGKAQDWVEKCVDDLGDAEDGEFERGEEDDQSAVEQTADKECFALDVDLDVRVKRQLGEHVEGFRGENDEGGCGVDENGLDERRGEGVPICRVGCLDLGEPESR